MKKKILARLLAASLSIGSLIFNPIVDAAIKNYIGFDDTSYVGELESQEIVRLRAIDKAKRNAQEKAGVYLASYSRSSNFRLTDDEIVTVTNNIVDVINVQCEPELVEAGNRQFIVYKATVEVSIDTDGINDWLRRQEEDRQRFVRQNKEALRTASENDERLAMLKDRAENISTEKERTDLKREFDVLDKEFLSNQKVEEGDKYLYDRDYGKAVDAYFEAIELNPTNKTAKISLFALSFVYGVDQSAYDLKKATEFVNGNDTSHYDKNKLKTAIEKEQQRTIAYCTYIIELDPGSAASYERRGTAYYNHRDYEQALTDFNKAIELDPDYAAAYFERGWVYKKLGDEPRAQADFAKARALGYVFEQDFSMRQK